MYAYYFVKNMEVFGFVSFFERWWEGRGDMGEEFANFFKS